MECRRQLDERLVVGFFIAQKVPLHFHADVRGAENADDAIDEPADAEAAAAQRRPADEGDESPVWPSSSSSASDPSPLGARSFIRVTRRQRLR